MLRVGSALTPVEDDLITRILQCGFAVHSELGPGFRERIYERAFCLELDAQGLKFECEKPIDVRYKTWTIPGQRVDLVVEGLVVVEVKTVAKLLILHERQVRSYLKTMGLRAGLLLNFNTPQLKFGLRRIVSTLQPK